MSRQYRFELLSGRARVCVRLAVIGEIARRERAVRPVGLVDDGYMRLDAVLLDQPSEHRARAICGVRDQTLGIEAEAIQGPVDHGPRRAGLGCADRPARLHVDDDPVVGVDQVIVGVCEECGPVPRSRPLAGRIRMRRELRRDLGGRPERGVVERVQVFPHGTGRISGIDRVRVPVFLGRGVLFVGISLDQTGIHGEAFTADHALCPRPPCTCALAAVARASRTD